jgi:hypothetical protein
MAALNYVLCSITAFLCAVLLFRGFHRSKTRLLLWSGICFLLLCLENLLLFVDVVIIPDIHFTVARLVPGALAVCALLYGLIWESE